MDIITAMKKLQVLDYKGEKGYWQYLDGTTH